jgi:hypothetical protein
MTGTAIDIDSALSRTPRSDHIEPVDAVMAARFAAIHVLLKTPKKDMDARDKRGRDGQKLIPSRSETLSVSSLLVRR